MQSFGIKLDKRHMDGDPIDYIAIRVDEDGEPIFDGGRRVTRPVPNRKEPS